MPSNSKAQNYPPLTHGDSCVTLDSLYRLHKVGLTKRESVLRFLTPYFLLKTLYPYLDPL